MTFHIYRDHNNEWRWFLQAANGRRIAVSGEGYHNEKDCIDAISLVMGTNHQTQVSFT
jgi:uncharacterized protein YegP (UPF0339 family)